MKRFRIFNQKLNYRYEQVGETLVWHKDYGRQQQDKKTSDCTPEEIASAIATKFTGGDEMQRLPAGDKRTVDCTPEELESSRGSYVTPVVEWKTLPGDSVVDEEDITADVAAAEAEKQALLVIRLRLKAMKAADLDTLQKIKDTVADIARVIRFILKD
jgi:hypothetical protein